MQGEDNDSIGSSAFVNVCRNYGLVQLININDLREGSLKALSYSEEQKREKKDRDAMAALAAATAAAASASSLFSSGYKNPQERAAAKKNGGGLIALRKAYSQGNLRKQSVLLSPMSSSSSSSSNNNNMHLINIVKKVTNIAPPQASSIVSDGGGDSDAAAAENANANETDMLPSPIASPLANLFQKLKESSSPLEQSPIANARLGKSLKEGILRSLSNQKLAEEGPDDSESDDEGTEGKERKSANENNSRNLIIEQQQQGVLKMQVHVRQPPPYIKPVDTTSFLAPNIEVGGASGHKHEKQQQHDHYHSPYDADEGSHLHGRLNSDEPPVPVTGLLVREQLRLRREQRHQQKHLRVQAQTASFTEMKERELMEQDE